MAITEAYAVTATVGTAEMSMTNGTSTPAAVTDTGAMQAVFDLSSMAIGDAYALRIYGKVMSGGSLQLLYEAIVVGTQAPTYIFPSLIVMHGWEVTAQKAGGTDRSISCSIRMAA